MRFEKLFWSDVFFLLILFSGTVSGEITEIMYNPVGSDNNKEYVEVIFDIAIGMNDWSVEDDGSSDVLKLLNGTGLSKFNLIVEEGFDVSFLDLGVISVYSAGAAIGNNLGNSGDVVIIRNENSSVVENVTYSGSFGNSNGMAVCFDLSGEYECVPSPGEENYDNSSNSGGGGGSSGGGGGEINNNQNIIESDGESYIEIDYVNGNNGSFYFCESFGVGLNVWNHRFMKEEITIRIEGVDGGSSLKINPQEGQSIEVPVVVCDSEEELEEGDYVLVAEGFGEDDKRAVHLEHIATQKMKVDLENVYKEISEENIESDINTSLEKERVKEVVYDERGTEVQIMHYLLILVSILAIYYVVVK